MSSNSHLTTLKNKHNQLKNSIRIASGHFGNDLTVRALKKEKLLLKERMLKFQETLV
jgi:hypothetical protein